MKAFFAFLFLASSLLAEERYLLAADNQVIEIDRGGKVVSVLKHPGHGGIYDAWRLPDGGIAYAHRGGLAVFDAAKKLVMEHKAVAEVAVIGKPDPVRTEIVKAVIVLKAGFSGTEELKAEIQQMVRQRLSTHAYPREIDFVNSLPKTPSGKIQRFILRGDAR